MVNCCVPGCTSKKGKTLGVTFHEFPSVEAQKQQWLDRISRQGEKRGSKWIPSQRSTVCSLHFTTCSFSISTTRKRLLPNATPTVFENFPPHLQKNQLPKRRKSPKKRCLNTGPTTIPVRVLCELNENNGNENLPNLLAFSDAAVQVSILDKKMNPVVNILKKANRRLKKQANALRIKVKTLRRQLKRKLKKKKVEKQLETIISEAGSGNSHSMQAEFLIEQISAFGKKKAKYEVNTLKMCALLQKRSPKAYRLLRQLKILHLPHPSTLRRYIGYPSGETGVTTLVKARLAAELKGLKHEGEKFGSLIIDEMAIKQKLLYDRRLDMFLGQETISQDLGIQDQLANRLLCFLFRGLSTSFRIPVAFFFTNSLKAIQLKDLTLNVLKAVEEQGFTVVRVVTDNLSVNTSMFKLLSGKKNQPQIAHPLDKQRKLFLAFDQSHILKNVRSQFLTKTYKSNGKMVTAKHVKRLAKYQKSLTGIVKPVRFLTRKHLYPSNLEKMNVSRAVQLFSAPVTAALETMKDLAPEKIENVDSLNATVEYMNTFRKWFDIHDSCNRMQGYRDRNHDKLPFTDSNDERLEWLQKEFIDYVTEIQAAGKSKDEVLSDETFHALCFTSVSTSQCIQYLIQNGFHFVLTRAMSGDDVEALFSHLRQMGGYNDSMDVKACTHAIETTLKTGIIASSLHANVNQDGTEFLYSAKGKKRRATLAESQASGGTPDSVHTNHKELSAGSSISTADVVAPLELPPYILAMLNKIHQPGHVSPTLKTASVAMIAGYLVRVVDENVTCSACLSELSVPKSSALLNRLIFHQDRGGLIYPSMKFVSVLDAIANFVGCVLNIIDVNISGIRTKLRTIIQPHLERCFSCTECNNEKILKIILDKFLNPLLDNWGKAKTDNYQPVKKLTSKPVSRKLLKMS